MKKIARKTLYLFLGHIGLVLALIGAILPVMPTTPFAIFAAYFYSRSSPRLHRWILSLPVLGRAIADWELNKSISMRSKLLATVMLMGSIIGTWFFSSVLIHWKILHILITAGVLGYVWSRPSTSGVN